MSEQEQDAAILRIVKDRAEAKRKRLLLENELRVAGKAFYELGSVLQHLSSFNVDPSSTITLVEKHSAVLGSFKITQMMREYADVHKAIQDYDMKAKELGID